MLAHWNQHLKVASVCNIFVGDVATVARSTNMQIFSSINKYKKMIHQKKKNDMAENTWSAFHLNFYYC